jgi:extracellular elastinolytic metalloproteinase
LTGAESDSAVTAVAEKTFTSSLDGLITEAAMVDFFRNSTSFANRVLFLVLVSLIFSGRANGQTPPEQRDFDARIVPLTNKATPAASQLGAFRELKKKIPDLSVTYDPVSGAARSVSSHTGYLTPPGPSEKTQESALAFAYDVHELLGLSPKDLAGHVLAGEVYSKVTGTRRLYFNQTYRDVSVYNGQLQINTNRDGRVISLINTFVADLARSVNALEPQIGPVEAMLAVAEHLEIELFEKPRVLSVGKNSEQVSRLMSREMSRDPIIAKLFWFPVGPGETRLVWNLQVQTLDSLHWYEFNVDAVSAEIWTRFDWVDSGVYRVYEQPVESPQHTTPLPPADARSLVIDPEDSFASPAGWFSGGIMAGNNVHACPDTSPEDDVCDSNPPCSGTTCDFSINLSGAPSTYVAAATANLFYWNNVIHDIQYQYGFDEAAGNFQEDDFGNGGLGSDSVNAQVQDGGGNCNANFLTPPDGSNPRMQMYTCTNASPAHDGDLDNAVIVHEYAHGISNRQVGGPGNVSCLSNSQQPGEGWSDWHGLVYTAETGDRGTDPRGIGSWLFNLDPDGTIRDLPYSTDPAINSWTYESISGAGIPHGVGSRWAQALWKVFWALVDKHGFDPDLLHPGSFDAGNQRALLYVNEGMKNTACSPTFLDARDGVVQAAIDNFEGEDVCTVWQAFASFGLGIDATTPGPSSTTATNGFRVPSQCTFACTGEAIVVNDIHAQLSRVEQTASPFDLAPISDLKFDGQSIEVNNMGFRKTDGLLYAVQLNATGNDQILQIGPDGTVIGLGRPAGLPEGTRFSGGDISKDGAEMFLSAYDQDLYTVVDLGSFPLTTTPKAIVGDSGAVHDWAYNPVDGRLYGGDNYDGELARLDPVSGVRTDFEVAVSPGLPGLAHGSAFGGAWFDATGRLFLHQNSGTIFEIDLGNPAAPTPTIVAADSGPAVDRNDAANCAQSVLGAAKQMTTASASLPTTITIFYTFENFGATALSQLSAEDDLTTVFGSHGFGVGADWSFISISSMPASLANPSFDGHADTELINSGQVLPPSSTATITVEIELKTFDNLPSHGYFCNQVQIEGESVSGVLIGDLSTEGFDPDPNHDGFPVEHDPACLNFTESAVEPPCTAEAFSVQDIDGKLYEVAADGTLTLLGTVGMEINNLGLRSTDGLFYGSELSPTDTVQIVQLDANAAVFELGRPPGLPQGVRMSAGDVSRDGHWMYLNAHGAPICRVDLTHLPNLPTAVCQNIEGGAGYVFDWAAHPTNGLLYGGDSTDGQLAILDPITGQRSDLGVGPGTGCGGQCPDLPSGGAVFGSAWFDALGRLVLHKNDGDLYKIDIASREVVDFVSTGTPVSRNDGAACVP